MNGTVETPVHRDARIENFAVELALTAYRVALRTRTQGSWLDLDINGPRSGHSMLTTEELLSLLA